MCSLWLCRLRFSGSYKLAEATAPPCPAASYPSASLSHPCSPPSPQWWGRDGGFGFATFGGFIGKVSANSAPRPQTHTHSLSQQWPRGSPTSLWLLVLLRPWYSCTSGPGFYILDASSPSVGPVPLRPLLPSAGRGLVLGQWYVLKQQFSYSAGHTLGNHGTCPYLRQGFESVWFIWKEIPNKEGE